MRLRSGPHAQAFESATPGYGGVRVEPKPAGLRWARGTVPTPQGTVAIAWEHEADGGFTLRLDLPPGTEAEVIWPTADRPELPVGVAPANDGVLRVVGPRVLLRSGPMNGPK